MHRGQMPVTDDSYGAHSNRDRRRERGDRERERDRDRDRDHYRDRRRRTRSRSHSRERDRDRHWHRSPNRQDNNWDKKRSGRARDSRSRSRDRDYNERDRGYGRRGRERNQYYDDSGNSHGSEWDYHQNEQYQEHEPEQPFGVPNCTIMASNIPPQVTENELRSDILRYGLVPKDIRLIRRKGTGASRGFAFVEFALLAEAVRWMDDKQGVLMLDEHQISLQYSFAKENPADKSNKVAQDWFCANCGEFNFKRREQCYKCQAPRSEAEVANDVQKEISAYPTSTILFRDLDVLTTEDKVLALLPALHGPAANLPIKSVRLGRDPLTNLSMGVCYLEMNNTGDAMRLFAALSEIGPLYIDGRPVQISYCKATNCQTAAKVAAIASKASLPAAATAISAAQWSANSSAGQYSVEDIPHLAEYSASMYAKTPEEHVSYLQYYTQYYTSQLQQQQSSAGAETATQAAPDLSKYTYDSQSGYYFDAVSGLYYDANTQYFYNSQTQQFSYWDTTTNSFVPVSNDASAAASQAASSSSTATDKKDSKPAKADKTSEAKRIAKDMEKWAKTMNQRKEAARPMQQYQQQQAAAIPVETHPAPVAAAFREPVREDKSSLHEVLQVLQRKQQEEEDKQPIVAAYGSSSDSDGDERSSLESLVDWNKLACLLCKRQFNNKETLQKHQQLSDLHKQNLDKWKLENSASAKAYRDRAKERRLKYGESDPPVNNKYKEKFFKGREETSVPAYEQPTVKGITGDNVGSKMLQKMGWQTGQGLGKSNQGRTTIIEADRRSATAGLGTSTYGAVAGDTYRETVKKMTMQRFRELDES